MRPFHAICLMLGSILLTHPARAQTGDQNAAPPAAAAPATTATEPAAPLLKPAELDGLVAPIALYPDTLLANVLMAATYPLEVVQAERWVKDNSKLGGDALKATAEKQSWDASVKALVAAPSVLQMMSEKLDWTQKLGEAFLAQQQDVMDAVQRLRSKAYDRQKLSTTKEQIVTVRQEQNRQMIYIQPGTPDTLYVPYYDPPVMFGDWPYADYPAYPYYWGYPGYIAAGVIATGLAFGAGYALGRWRSGYWGGGGYWGGSRINWGGGAIDINRGARVEHWRHNTAHRQGVRYNNANLQQRFGNAGQRPSGGRQGLGQGASRPNAGDRAKAVDRSRQAGAKRSAGNRQAANRSRGSAGRSAGHGSRAGRAATRPTSRASHFRPQAGSRRASAGGIHRAAARGGGGFRGGGAAHFRGGGGGGFRGGGGGRGGGRRSDIALKHDIALLGYLGNGLGYYRFAYNGSDKTYVGVMAQEVGVVRPDAIERGRDGYLRVHYEMIGLRFQTYDDWIASGARIPKIAIGLHDPQIGVPR